MSILTPHLPLDPTETFLSFASRLAAFHIGRGLYSFLADLGISFRAVRAGEEKAVSCLAEAAGIAPEALARTTIRLTGNSVRQFRGETFSPEFIPTCEVRVCPLCLAEDEAEHPKLPPAATWKQRIAWRLRPVTCCPTHEVGLVDVAPGGSVADMPEFGLLVTRAGGLPHLIDRAEPRLPGSLQIWVHQRLDGHVEAEGSWLAAHSIEQGARACEVLGAELVYGQYRSLKSRNTLALADWEAAGAYGLRVAKEGAQAVWAALDALRARSTRGAVQAGPEAAYGLVYTWLHFRSPAVEAGPIREMLREHILSHTAIEPGEVVLGEPLVERRMHSERSIAQALGLQREEARRRLVRVGLMPRGLSAVAAAKLAFPAQEAERLCTAVETAVPLQAAANLLGCTKAQAESLCDAGVVLPFTDQGLSGSTHRVVFAVHELTDLLARVRGMATKIDVGSGTLDLDAAAQLVNLTFGRLVAMVLDQRIPRPCWLGLRSGLSALRLREIDLCDGFTLGCSRPVAMKT